MKLWRLLFKLAANSALAEASLELGELTQLDISPRATRACFRKVLTLVARCWRLGDLCCQYLSCDRIALSLQHEITAHVLKIK